MKSYEQFRRAIAMSESSGNYGCRNTMGYLGAYQFGMAELCDLGAATRIPGTFSLTNACFNFVPPMTEEAFLSDPAYQDNLFDQHVRRLAARFRKIGMTSNLSGAIAAAHLVGYQAALEYLTKGKKAQDAFGTTAEHYFHKFSGYEIDQ